MLPHLDNVVGGAQCACAVAYNTIAITSKDVHVTKLREKSFNFEFKLWAIGLILRDAHARGVLCVTCATQGCALGSIPFWAQNVQKSALSGKVI